MEIQLNSSSEFLQLTQRRVRNNLLNEHSSTTPLVLSLSRKFLSCLIVAFSLTSCGPSEIPGGEITLKNDIQDKDYNVVEIDQVRTEGGGGGYSVSLKPGQSARVPLKNVRSLRWIRRYKDHTNVYLVECPPGFNKKITMKLIDVYSNRISGGCKLVRTGQMVSGSYVKWEK